MRPHGFDVVLLSRENILLPASLSHINLIYRISNELRPPTHYRYYLIMAHDEQDYIDGWQTYSDWIDNLRSDSELITLHYDGSQAFRDKLMSCQSNFERFRLLWTDQELKGQLTKSFLSTFGPSDRITKYEKSISESDRLRSLGNKSFRNDKHEEALNLYTQAVKFAPHPTEENPDTSLALALANRSAALYNLNRFKLCLLDVELALKNGYPKEKRFKLLIRKVKSLHILSVWSNDLEEIKNELRKTKRSNETEAYVKSEIQSMFDFIDDTEPSDIDKDDMDLVDEMSTKICNVNKTLPNAADCVEMSYDQEKGRYLLTNKDVSYGRLLLAEDPYACNLAWSRRNSYCYNCLGDLYSCGIGCPNCTQILYCSEECSNARSDLHSIECNNLLDIQKEVGVAYLVAHIMYSIEFELSEFSISAKRTTTKKTLNEILEMPLSEWPDLDYKNNYTSLLSLMDHSNDFDYDAMMGYTLTAVYLLIAFIDRLGNKFPCLMNEAQQLVIGSIVLRHLFQIQSNLVSILHQDLSNLTSGRYLTGMLEKPIGVGIYPTISLLNHSCNPNIISVFNRNKFIARAGKSLECGTELNYCYGPSVKRMSKRDRQAALKEQYFFECKCECCSSNIEDETRALRCGTCDGPVIYHRDLTSECSNCHIKNVVDVKVCLDRIEAIKLSILRLQKDELPPETKIQKYLELQEDLKRVAYWRNPLFIDIKMQLVNEAEFMDDYDLELKFCQEELDLCSKVHGEYSYEHIMTMVRYVRSKFLSVRGHQESAGCKQKQEELKEELKSILPFIAETKTKLRDLLASTNIIGAEASYESEITFLNEIQNEVNKYSK